MFIKIGTVTRFQIPDSYSHSVNIGEKGMLPTFLLIVVGKQEGRTVSLTFVWKSFEKENFEFKPANHCLRIDLESHPAPADELVKCV